MSGYFALSGLSVSTCDSFAHPASQDADIFRPFRADLIPDF